MSFDIAVSITGLLGIALILAILAYFYRTARSGQDAEGQAGAGTEALGPESAAFMNALVTARLASDGTGYGASCGAW